MRIREKGLGGPARRLISAATEAKINELVGRYIASRNQAES